MGIPLLPQSTVPSSQPASISISLSLSCNAVRNTSTHPNNLTTPVTMRAAAAVLALAAVAVKAQSGPQNYSSSLDMTIDPNTIDASERASWCTGQSNSCDTLCDDDASTNDCDYTDLSYDCKCASNDSAPGLQYYRPTMPSYICEALFGQCNVQYANDADAQQGCADNIQSLCGTIDVSKADIGGDDDDDEDSDNVTTTNSDDFAAPTAGPQVVAALGAMGLFAAFPPPLSAALPRRDKPRLYFIVPTI